MNFCAWWKVMTGMVGSYANISTFSKDFDELIVDVNHG